MFPAPTAVELSPIAKLALESSLSPILNHTAEVSSPIIRKMPELTEVRATSELWTTSAVSAEEPEASSIVAAAATPAMESVTASEIEPIGLEHAIAKMTTRTEETAVRTIVAGAAPMTAMETLEASMNDQIGE